MTIPKFKPGAQPAPEPLLPKTQPDAFKGVVIDDKYTPLNRLAVYAEGYPETVDYYGQVLGQDNEAREVDPGQNGVYQQYTKINGMNIRVSQPLDLNYNDSTSLSEIRGTASMLPQIIPNAFDYFVIRTTRGKSALFRITKVVRLSINRDTMHEVQYQMVGYTDMEGTAKIQFESLEKKKIKDLYFHLDRVLEGQSPLLKEEDHLNVQNLQVDYGRIVAYYFATFYNLRYQTLILPGQPTAVYDKFVTDFVLKIVSLQDAENVRKVRQLGTDNDRFMEQPQFWKAIIERNPLYIHQGNKYMGLATRRQFLMNHQIAGAGMATIDHYVYPLEVDQSTLIDTDPRAKIGEFNLTDTMGANGTFYSQGNNEYVSPTGNVPIYKRVLCDTCYVLSRDFYGNESGWSLLEKVVWDFLENKAVSLKELAVLSKAFYNLNRLEQFYYGPLIIMLIKDSGGSQYT